MRVLGCDGSGTNSGVIAGIDWVTAHHRPGQPAVANVSLGGPPSRALDTAVNTSINDGVAYAVAAGNDNLDACGSSPARVVNAITVGSTSSTDARSSFSNYGACLDLFAPGTLVTSAWHTSDTTTSTISGTSMAAPHAAGVAALYLQATPSAGPTKVRNSIVSTTTANAVKGAGAGSPNKLLYSLFGATAPSPPAPLPITTGCALPETYSGSLSGTGDYDVQPNGTSFHSAAGTHTACLQGASGTDFDLYLVKWNGSTWVTVAQGATDGSTERVTYVGTSGYYAWEVDSYLGSGSYAFDMGRP